MATEQKDSGVDSQPIEASKDDSIAFGAEETIELGMSTRAGALRDYLVNKEEVSAILLKADGTSEEIKSSTSSKQIRTLLAGKATIIGEIEDLHVLVVRSMDGGKNKNQHQLPVPLCHGTFTGDYLLYRMDDCGKPVDLALSEYTKFVEDHKALTETAIKNFSTDSLQIKSCSPFGSTARDARLRLMGEIECQLRCDKDAEDMAVDHMAISKAVEQKIQELVDSTIAGWSSSRMEDPDYTLEEEAVSNDSTPSPAEEPETERKEEALDERSWRDQLNDALHHVREIGKMDGQVFAQRLSETFYEINGEEPSTNQLREVYSKIKNEFAIEAQQEGTEEANDEQPALDDIAEEEAEEEAVHTVDEDEEEEIEEQCSSESSPSGSEAEEVDVVDSDQEVDGDVVMADMSPLETLKFATETVGNDWVSRAESLWRSQKGREPTEKELAKTVKQLAQDFADSVLDITTETMEQDETEQSEDSADGDSENEASGLEQGDSADEEGSESAEEDVPIEDEDYDPDNSDDVVMAEIDDSENLKHDKLHFDDIMLTTPITNSKRGKGGCSWKVYFDESELSELKESANLQEATIFFKAINKRDPTGLELHKMRTFLSVPNEVGDVMEDDAGNILSSRCLKSNASGATSWNLCFGPQVSAEEAVRNLKNAIRGFKIRNGREPTKLEINDLQKFLTVPVEEEDEADEASCSPSKVLVTPVKEKKNSVRMNVYLEGSRYSQEKSEKLAIRCFKKFNQRDPNEEELAKIKSFVKTDSDLLIEQTYLVSDKATSVVLDDEKEMEIPVRTTTKGIVSKKSATGYLLDFDDAMKREHGDATMATKWFERFNHREPTEEEVEQIKQFVAATDGAQDEMIDID